MTFVRLEQLVALVQLVVVSGGGDSGDGGGGKERVNGVGGGSGGYGGGGGNGANGMNGRGETDHHGGGDGGSRARGAKGGSGAVRVQQSSPPKPRSHTHVAAAPGHSPDSQRPWPQQAVDGDSCPGHETLCSHVSPAKPGRQTHSSGLRAARGTLPIPPCASTSDGTGSVVARSRGIEGSIPIHGGHSPSTAYPAKRVAPAAAGGAARFSRAAATASA